jgi:prepilin-type N-terminal cleavage/methylation domain-containing protein
MKGSRSGFSLVEVIVALVVLSVGIIGVMGLGAVTTRQYRAARADLGLWATLQTVGDSLQQRGHGAVTGSSRTIGEYSFSWSVDSAVANLHRVTLAGWSSASAGGVADTVIIFLAKPDAS